jgi:hypothetical protein
MSPVQHTPEIPLTRDSATEVDLGLVHSKSTMRMKIAASEAIVASDQVDKLGLIMKTARITSLGAISNEELNVIWKILLAVIRILMSTNR